MYAIRLNLSGILQMSKWHSQEYVFTASRQQSVSVAHLSHYFAAGMQGKEFWP
jgi:hypothetical protein